VAKDQNLVRVRFAGGFAGPAGGRKTANSSHILEEDREAEASKIPIVGQARDTPQESGDHDEGDRIAKG
jgi:hypothetical protein